MNFEKSLMNHMRAGCSGVSVVTSEVQRAVRCVLNVSKKLNREVFYWSASQGFRQYDDNMQPEKIDNGLDDETYKNPLMALMVIQSDDSEFDESVFVFQDMHMLMGDKDITLVDAVRTAVASARKRKQALIFIGCDQRIPAELEKDLAVIEIDLPDREEISVLFKVFEASLAPKPTGKKQIKKEQKEQKPVESEKDHVAIVNAACGMTEAEIENAAALSIVEKGSIIPEIIMREKIASVKKSGILDLMVTKESLSDIGGLDVMKDWLKRRANAESEEAVEFGLPTPKGILIVGIPGSGKSLTAKATANILNRPLIRMDVGKVFGGIVGQSEANMRSAIKMAEAVAPVVLFVDEFEKAFSGTKSSNATDGGTSSRVFGSFLSWLNDKKLPVFVVATANDVTQIPPEMLRKGRFDELFFCDIPNELERAAIWKIQIEKYKRNPAQYDLVDLARKSDGFTGAEIEQVVIDSLYEAFGTTKVLSSDILIKRIKSSVPLSRTMKEQILAMQEWAKTRAVMASVPTEKPVKQVSAGSRLQLEEGLLSDDSPF